MNKFKSTLLALTAITSVNAFGASIDHIQNYSAEYGANPAQQGAINMGSTVYFNPAGLMELENGTYMVGGLQYAFGEQEIEGYGTNLSSPIPNFALYKKDDNKALFLTMGGVAGGAELEYKDGVPFGDVPLIGNPSDFLQVTGYNMYGQATIGMAYKFAPKWSASVGFRGVMAERNLEVKGNVPSSALGSLAPLAKDGIQGDFNSERSATGYGFQLGLNYAHSEKLNVGFRYDSKVNLEFETDATTSGNDINLPALLGGATLNGGTIINGAITGAYPVYKDGTKIRRDLPALAAIGAQYKVDDKLTTFTGMNYYFNSDAKMDGEKYDNGYEFSVGAQYQLNEKYAALVGFNYAKTGAPKDTYSIAEYAIDSSMIGAGVKYTPNETTEFTVAFNHYFYETTSVQESETVNKTYSKEISSIGFNFAKRF